LNITHLRLHAQQLLGSRLERPQDVVQWLGAVQSQDYPGAKWGLAQRLNAATDAGIDRAFAEGSFLHTHVLRPTWHFVIPEDIRWMLELTAPRIKKTLASYDRGLELEDTVYAAANAAFAQALQDGTHLTRAELGGVLEDASIIASGQRLAHIVMRAELDAVICSGVPRGKQQTYALLSERAPDARRLYREEALAELTRRYFTSHGPALAQDFAWWSGLRVADATTGIQMVKGDLASETVEGKTYWFSPSNAEPYALDAIAHLLPNYDEYLIAYRDRNAFFDPSRLGDARFFRDVLRRHILVVDGQVTGGWYSAVKRDDVVIQAIFLTELNAGQRSGLERAAKEYARFLGKSAAILAQANSHERTDNS
jgi:hypothetical protein